MVAPFAGQEWPHLWGLDHILSQPYSACVRSKKSEEGNRVMVIRRLTVSVVALLLALAAVVITPTKSEASILNYACVPSAGIGVSGSVVTSTGSAFCDSIYGKAYLSVVLYADGHYVRSYAKSCGSSGTVNSFGYNSCKLSISISLNDRDNLCTKSFVQFHGYDGTVGPFATRYSYSGGGCYLVR